MSEDPAPQYFAGLFDGEGCVGIYRIHPNPGRYELYVQLGMCDLAPLYALTKKFGGRVNLTSKKSCRGYGLWVIRGKRARPFLESVLPFCLVKAPQIRLALQFLDTLVSPFPGNSISLAVVSVRDEINIKLRALKRARSGPFAMDNAA